MPRGFTEHERIQIRQSLLEHGRRMLETVGASKISVEELTTAAGISKGAFYLFFPSKEDLFFEVLQGYEREVRARLLADISDIRHGGREQFRAMLHGVIDLWRDHPLTARLSRDEYARLARRLPPERVAAHLAEDARFAGDFVAHWRQAGLPITAPPALVAELIRALFFVSLHSDEFSPGMWPGVISVLIDGIVDYLIGTREGNR